MICAMPGCYKLLQHLLSVVLIVEIFRGIFICCGPCFIILDGCTYRSLPHLFLASQKVSSRSLPFVKLRQSIIWGI